MIFFCWEQHSLAQAEGQPSDAPRPQICPTFHPSRQQAAAAQHKDEANHPSSGFRELSN
jgi:hypothetical protein